LLKGETRIGERESPGCIAERWRGGTGGLVKGVLSARERLSETPPGVKSSRGDETWYVNLLKVPLQALSGALTGSLEQDLLHHEGELSRVGRSRGISLP